MFYEHTKKYKIFNKLNSLLQSKYMIMFLVLLAGISNIFEMEIPVYYTYTFIIILTTLFGEDMLPLLPISCCGYMTFSKSSNPLGVEDSTFRNSSNTTHLFIIGITIGIFAISRIIYDVIKHKERRTKPKLLTGFILLAITSLLGGLTTEYYGTKTVFFGLLQSLTISFSYFIFFYSVDWKKVKKDYFPFLLLCMCILMLAECINTYIECNVLDTNSAFFRLNLFTGWGMYNNIALICALTLPAPFYYAYTKENKIPYVLLSIAMYLNMIILQSRNGILFSTIIFITGTILIFKNSKRKKLLSSIYIGILIALLITSSSLLPNLKHHFDVVLEKGFYNGDRAATWKEAMRMLIRSPLFGEGFYSFKGYIFNLTSHTPTFLPARMHNTYLQQLASCGLLGIFAYIYHRYQTVKLLRRTKKEASLVVLKTSILVFLLMSIFDCHFHNLGPGFIYSAMLLILEKVYYKEKEEDII